MICTAQAFSTDESRDVLTGDPNNANAGEYNAVDLARFICAILVVSIHVAPFGAADDRLVSLLNYVIQNWLARIAAPIFFAASGFFLYRKTPLERFSLSPTRACVVKLARLYVIWALIYSPFRLKAILEDGRGIVHGIFDYAVFMGRYTQLWFIPALIVSVVLVSFLLSRRIGIRKILTAALFFYALGLLGQSWFGVLAPLRTSAPEIRSLLETFIRIIGTTRNGLFDGFLFVGMGAYIAFNGFKIPQKKALLLFAASYLLMFAEAFFVKYFDLARANDMYIFLAPSTYLAFGLLVNFRMTGRGGAYRTLRALSALIYYSHLWILSLVGIFLNLIGVQAGVTCLPFMLTVIGSAAFSYAVYRLSKFPFFKWLKILYS